MTTIRIPVVIEATIEVVTDEGDTAQDAYELLRAELLHTDKQVSIGNSSFVFNLDLSRLFLSGLGQVR
jgi:hypothetical protein